MFDYLHQGHAASSEDKNGVSLIRWCAYYGDVSAIRFLLANGESLDALGETFGLNGAAFHGHWQLCQFIIEKRGRRESSAARNWRNTTTRSFVYQESLGTRLREVFEYEYHEIATITRLTEGNCRQILRRARQHITEGRPRFDPTPEKRDELLERFLGATVEGDMDGLISILSNDIVLYTDGGGKASAVPEPIYGPVNVSRLLIMSLRKFAPKNLEIRRAKINGQPGILGYADGIAETVIILNIADEHIRNIYIVRNPEKLTRVSPLSTDFVC